MWITRFSFWMGLCLCCLLRATDARVTLKTMRELTDLTDELRERIVGSGNVEFAGGVGGREQGQDQMVLASDRGDGEEVEITVTAALTTLASSLLSELEKPVEGLDQDPLTHQECKKAIEEFHAHLAATTKFLYAIQERQMIWNWKAESPVFDGVSWLQALWASRRANTEELSFIEQQLVVYKATGCWGKGKEVLRRDVEVVEYLNDLMDSFR